MVPTPPVGAGAGGVLELAADDDERPAAPEDGLGNAVAEVAGGLPAVTWLVTVTVAPVRLVHDAATKSSAANPAAVNRREPLLGRLSPGVLVIRGV